MKPSKINSVAISIVVAVAIILTAGYYTRNGGFQLAGFLLLLVGCVLVFNQARYRKGNKTL